MIFLCRLFRVIQNYWSLFTNYRLYYFRIWVCFLLFWDRFILFFANLLIFLFLICSGFTDWWPYILKTLWVFIFEHYNFLRFLVFWNNHLSACFVFIGTIDVIIVPLCNGSFNSKLSSKSQISICFFIILINIGL
jgi:hypothetical protein